MPEEIDARKTLTKLAYQWSFGVWWLYERRSQHQTLGTTTLASLLPCPVSHCGITLRLHASHATLGRDAWKPKANEEWRSLPTVGTRSTGQRRRCEAKRTQVDGFLVTACVSLQILVPHGLSQGLEWASPNTRRGIHRLSFLSSLIKCWE
jgi:hypothetical protein